MAYVATTFVFGEQPSAAKWNQLGANDASFNDGTGIFGLYKNLLTVDSNPYKFKVYRNAAQNVGTGATKVNFDTESFDTNSNFDSTTNFRYVAPVDGYYWLSTNIQTTTAGSGTDVLAMIYKNGAENIRGGYTPAAAGTAPGSTASGLVQLNATEYVEVFVATGTAAKALDVGSAAKCTFSGFLVSRT